MIKKLVSETFYGTRWGLSPHLVPISVAEGPHLVPISLKMRSPFGPHFEKFRSPFHVGAVLPLLLEALPLLLLAQVNRTKDPDDDSKMGCKQFY